MGRCQTSPGSRASDVPGINRVGHCTACDKPIAVILRVYQGTGHDEVDGTPQAIGEWDDEAWRVTLLLIDGSRMQIDVCGPCAEMSGGRLMAAWGRICYAQGRTLDPAWLKAKGGVALTEHQRYWIRKTLSWFAQNAPLGILSMQRWGDLKDDRACHPGSDSVPG